jgi:hypothetical protein
MFEQSRIQSRDAAAVTLLDFLSGISQVESGRLCQSRVVASISAAHSAAPTENVSVMGKYSVKKLTLPVFVKEKNIDTTGMSSNKMATVPNL